MKKLIIGFGILFLLGGCAHKQPQPKEVILNFQSEIPIKVTFQKSCEGNWNFCEVDNYNFKKWE